MDLCFDRAVARPYSGPTRKARVLTEAWVAREAYCPACGHHPMSPLPNNSRAADFLCRNCDEEFELKSQKAALGARLADGSYGSMMQRIASPRAPNLLVMRYSLLSAELRDLIVIPKRFLVPSVVEQRPPLALTARRAGWVGCNILLGRIAGTGRIALVEASRPMDKASVLNTWRRTLFLRDQANVAARGWLVETMRVIEALGTPAFSVADVYRSELDLCGRYPDNRNIRAKLRQQLQKLRDAGYLEFQGRGRYRLR